MNSQQERLIAIGISRHTGQLELNAANISSISPYSLNKSFLNIFTNIFSIPIY